MKKTALVLLMAVCLLLVACSTGSYTYQNGEAYPAGGSAVTGQVEEIEINWVDGKVCVAYHDSEGVSLSERSDRKLSKDQQLHWYLDGKKLIVQYAAAGLRNVPSLDKELTVTLPKALCLAEMKINVVSSVVDAEGVEAESMEINTVSGKVMVTNAHVRKVEMASVSGNLDITLKNTPDKIIADSVSGSVRIGMPDGAGFVAEIDSVSGSVTGSFPMIGKNKNQYVCGDESCRISVNTVSGNVRLEEIK